MKNLFKVTLMTVALLSVACGPTGKRLTHQQADAMQESVLQTLCENANRSAEGILLMFRNFQEGMTETRQTSAETIWQACPQLTNPDRSLIDLPAGAESGMSDGRAGVEANPPGDGYMAPARNDWRCTTLVSGSWLAFGVGINDRGGNGSILRSSRESIRCHS